MVTRIVQLFRHFAILPRTGGEPVIEHHGTFGLTFGGSEKRFGVGSKVGTVLGGLPLEFYFVSDLSSQTFNGLTFWLGDGLKGGELDIRFRCESGSEQRLVLLQLILFIFS
jgi:hypothetical protein